MHVGEIALLEPFKGRSATVNVIDTTVVAQLSGQKFTEIAAHYPEMWRRIGIELARRLVRLENTVYGGVTA
jgi:CRP-like cAMP-binding protein